MSTKKVISFLIASASILVASLVITFTLILPATQLQQPQSIKAYAFNFNVINDSSIYQVTNTRLKLAENVVFSPARTTNWSDDLITFKGLTVSDGVEFSNTVASKYVCAIPFTIFNNYDKTVRFKLNVEVSGDQELTQNIVYKFYDYCDKTYKTIDEINCNTGSGKYSHIDMFFNEISAKQTANFCLVAIAQGEGQELNSLVNINLSVSIL